MPITVLDAYFKVHKQFILALSGISGCNKRKVAVKLSENFNAKLIDQFDYYKKNYEEIITISSKDGSKNVDIVNWDTDNAIDWDKFNADVINYSANSKVIILGFNLKSSLIKFNIDYHIFLNVNKSDCIKKRISLIEKKKDVMSDDYKLYNEGLFETKMYNVTIPHIDNNIKDMKINKFVKTSGLNTTTVAEIIWELVKNFLVSEMENFNKNEYFEWIKTNKFE